MVKDGHAIDVPLLATCRHLLQPSGKIVGKDVAEAILPVFPTFCSAIPLPTPLGPLTTSTHAPRIALASIDGRTPLTHERIRNFCVRDFGPTLHSLGFGKGDRIALVLPNGPELALAIFATAHWASCVPLSANGAISELEADLLRCGATLVIGPYSGRVAPSNSTKASRNHKKGESGNVFAFDFSNNNNTSSNNNYIRTNSCSNNSNSNDADRFNVSGSSPNRDWSAFRTVEDAAAKVGIPFVGLVPSPEEAGIFSLQSTRLPHPLQFDKVSLKSPSIDRQGSLTYDAPKLPLSRRNDGKSTGVISTEPNSAKDEVLVLFTSGTTGSKKLVPHVMGDMLTAAATIALSWDLCPSDVNCNLMPLFHVGGIVRQIFSPIFSGGCVICCPSFDPSIFWALLAKRAFTWYYAAPTMHQLILQTGKLEGMISEAGQCPLKLRMIANAAGGLLPSLAKEMLQVFDATVLPSYGMTECMPITSPPSTYRLDKTGTSGVAVGPELAILNTTTLVPLLPGEEGTICVRGEPCFRGYGKIANDDSDEATPETFLEGGWFNTGDLGYLDEDGYLFITGRSKEVINRGGEIISPMEVEEASMAHPDIVACAAFSALHNVLQEVVGIVVVMKAGRPRLDLSTLHEFLGERLAAPKWPQCLVFMDSLPKSHTNKLLRVKLGARLQLPELSDDMNTTERTFEAMCPPQGTALDVPIRAHRVNLYAIDIECQLSALLAKNGDQRLVVVPHSRRKFAFVCYLVNIDRVEALKTAIKCMARYSVPSHFVMTDEASLISKLLPIPNMTDASATILQEENPSRSVDPTVQGVKHLFTEILDLDYLPGPDANFFHLGGSSMMASQLASKIRKSFSIACSGSEVFQHASPTEMAKLICKRQRKECSPSISTKSISEDISNDSKSVSDHGAPFKTNRLAPQNTFGAALFQLVPLFIVFPTYQVSRYLLFLLTLVWSINHIPGNFLGLGLLGRFVITSFVYQIIWATITPLIFVVLKWIIIGRYKAGRYPIWGSYYLRWWFVDVMRKLFGTGIWNSNDAMLAMYYRMLGAKIGNGARVHADADVAEFDLVEIGEKAAIEVSTLRGFGVDNGAMILGPVKVGNYSSLGIKSIVAPYTCIPDNCHLGPVTSSYDAIALDITNARWNRKCFPGPPMWMQLLFIGPITFLVNVVAQIPPFFVLYKMILFKDTHDRNFTTLSDLIEWLADPHRIPFYIGIGLARALLSPFFYMVAALIVKKLIVGRFNAGHRNTSSNWQLLRHTMTSTLFTRDRIQNVTDLIGRHYEMVSVLYRLLGAKVGKRGKK
jgi:acyl-CoA synthetase (AMP-forming)/AMP-acid ligase II/acyl carrier protein